MSTTLATGKLPASPRPSPQAGARPSSGAGRERPQVAGRRAVARDRTGGGDGCSRFAMYKTLDDADVRNVRGGHVKGAGCREYAQFLASKALSDGRRDLMTCPR